MSTPLRLVRNYASNLTQIFKTVLQVGCISHCFLKYVADVAVCYGPSMEPTITSYDILVCEHISARLLRFNYGDIVISKSPTQPELYVCKRITGLPGDRISHRNHKIVPAGHVWLEGDNRDRSLDSNEYGPVPQGLIQGRVICRIWPLSDMSMLTVKSR